MNKKRNYDMIQKPTPPIKPSTEVLREGQDPKSASSANGMSKFLVVISIIAILVALLIPAIQQVT